MATRKLFTVHLHNVLTDEWSTQMVMAASKRKAGEIVARRTGWEWIITRIQEEEVP